MLFLAAFGGAACGTVLLWLGAACWLSLRRRAALPEGRRPTRGQAFWASLAVLVPATLGALVLLCLLCLWLSAHYIKQQAEFFLRSIELDEVQHLAQIMKTG